MLDRMLEVKEALQELVIGREWREWNKKSNHSDEGDEVRDCVLRSGFWKNLEKVLALTKGTITTTKEGHIAIQISSQTTKKTVSENPQFRTTIPRKLLSLCETLNFAPIQSQALRNSRN